MKRWFWAALLIILVVAFVFLKQGVHRSSLTDAQEQQMAKEAQIAQADKAEAAAKQAAATHPASPTTDASPDTTLPAEEVIGDPATARHHIEVGWIYEDTDVVNSGKLKAALAEVRTFAQKNGGTVSAVMVDLDVPTEDRSPAARSVTNLGVEVDGISIHAENPSLPPATALTEVLSSTIKP